MSSNGMFSELNNDAIEVYKDLTLSLIANPNGAAYNLFSLYNDIVFTISQNYYSELKNCSSPFNLGFVSGIVDSLKKDGFVDVLEDENKVDSYKMTETGLQKYNKLPHTLKVGVTCV